MLLLAVFLFAGALVHGQDLAKPIQPKSRYVPEFVKAANSAGGPRLPNVLIEDLTFLDSWRFFDFASAGHFARTYYNFTAARPFDLAVLDLYCKGDSFTLFNGTTKLGTSPAVPATCTNKTVLPSAAQQDPQYSQIVIRHLPAGPYYIKILIEDSPFGAGTAAIRISPSPRTARSTQ